MKANYLSKVKFLLCSLFVTCLLSCKPSNPERLDTAPVTLTYTKPVDGYDFMRNMNDKFFVLLGKAEKSMEKESGKMPFSFEKEKEGYENFVSCFNIAMKEYLPPYIIITPINPTIEDAQKMQALQSLYDDDQIVDMKFQSENIVETALYRIGKISLINSEIKLDASFNTCFEFDFSLDDLELVK